MKIKLKLIKIIAVTMLFGLFAASCGGGDEPVNDKISLSGKAVFTLNGNTPRIVELHALSWNDDLNDFIEIKSAAVNLKKKSYSMSIDKKYLNNDVPLKAKISDDEGRSTMQMIESINLNTEKIKHNIELHVVTKVLLGGLLDIKLEGAPYTGELLLEVVDEDDNWRHFNINTGNNTWEVELWAPDSPVTYFLWLQSPETDWHNTGITITMCVLVKDKPSDAIHENVNLVINILQKTKIGFVTAFDTNYDLEINMISVNVNLGDMIVVEILNRRDYTHKPVIECIWFVNGIMQDVNTSSISVSGIPYLGRTNLPTTGLTPGKQYGLVVVSIDGVAFANEFEFWVNE